MRFNIFLSDACLCPDCADIDECIENLGLGPCANTCVNTPGSFHCVCSNGYWLAGDGMACISKCPPGYRRKLSDPLVGNSAVLRCVGKCSSSLQATGFIAMMSMNLF